MRARISIIGADILCELLDAGQAADVRIPLDENVLTLFKDWTQQYKRAVRFERSIRASRRSDLRCLTGSMRAVGLRKRGNGQEAPVTVCIDIRGSTTLNMRPRLLSWTCPGRFWRTKANLWPWTRFSHSWSSGVSAEKQMRSRRCRPTGTSL